MPSVSQKGRLLPSSPIRKLAKYADDRKVRGVEVFHLNIGQPDIETPPKAMEAVRQHQLKILAYGPSEGTLTYRTKMVNYFASHQIHVSPENILVTTGASEALTITLGSIANDGDEIIIPEPFYANYAAFAAALGVRIKPLPAALENNFALPTPQEIEQNINPKTKALLICNPNNPTGHVYSETDMRALAALAKKHDLFLIVDEVYREFTYNGIAHFSVMQIPEIENHAILIDSMSKRYSMCGARVGCLVTKNQEVIETALKFAQSRLSPPSFAMIASEAALETEDDYFVNIKQEYQNRRDRLVAGLQKIEGVVVNKPQGAFYCLVKLPVDDTDVFCQWLLEKFEDQKQTIMLAPGSGFYVNPALGRKLVRMAYVLEEKALERAVEILDKALKTYNSN